MDISKVIVIAIVAIIFSMLIKPQRPEIGIIISIAAGILIFFVTISSVGSVVVILEHLADRASLNMQHLKIILKVIGIAYLTQFVSSIARDANESGIAHQIEFAGRILIIVLSIPIIMALLDLIIKIVE